MNWAWRKYLSLWSGGSSLPLHCQSEIITGSSEKGLEGSFLHKQTQLSRTRHNGRFKYHRMGQCTRNFLFEKVILPVGFYRHSGSSPVATIRLVMHHHRRRVSSFIHPFEDGMSQLDFLPNGITGPHPIILAENQISLINCCNVLSPQGHQDGLAPATQSMLSAFISDPMPAPLEVEGSVYDDGHALGWLSEFCCRTVPSRSVLLTKRCPPGVIEVPHTHMAICITTCRV